MEMEIETMIDRVIVPGLAGLDLNPLREDGRVVLQFRGQPAALDVRITPIERPMLIWLRFIPRIWVESEATEVLEALTTFNCHRWLVKAGRELEDGEVFFDAELPLYGPLDPDAFAAYFMATYETVLAFLPGLLRVQWGGQTVRELFAPPAAVAPEPLPPIVQEAAEIVAQVENDERP